MLLLLLLPFFPSLRCTGGTWAGSHNARLAGAVPHLALRQTGGIGICMRQARGIAPALRNVGNSHSVHPASRGNALHTPQPF